MNRREFLGNLIKIPVVGLSLVVLSGCEEERDKLIRQLQEASKDAVPYIDRKGYVYNVDVDGKKVEVNLSEKYFYRRNKLKYTVGNTSVRIWGDDIKVYDEKDLPIRDPDIISDAQEMTDKILKAVVKENERIRIEARIKVREQAKKDLN